MKRLLYRLVVLAISAAILGTLVAHIGDVGRIVNDLEQEELERQDEDYNRGVLDGITSPVPTTQPQE